ncbi:hypothetical protein KW790_02085 [Candidatus Parcubacteria bacterium]|nr:hypothetical protein [Candidatus Parcubacteria bacterium]
MVFQILFVISGAVIILLISAKVFEIKKRKSLLFLRLISHGDEHLRELSHQAAREYSEFKEDAEFFISKQLPLHSKNTYNKLVSFLQDKTHKYMGDIRGSKYFPQKSEGISEFFQSLSEKESGRIDDTLVDPDEIDSDTELK